MSKFKSFAIKFMYTYVGVLTVTRSRVKKWSTVGHAQQGTTVRLSPRLTSHRVREATTRKRDGMRVSYAWKDGK